MFKNIIDIKWDDKDKIINSKDFFVNCDIRDRKIGNNQIVWKALKKIVSCNEAFYVGIVPSTSAKEECVDLNDKRHFKINFLSWKEVEDFCDASGELDQVKRIFDYNKDQIY